MPLPARLGVSASDATSLKGLVPLLPKTCAADHWPGEGNGTERLHSFHNHAGTDLSVIPNVNKSVHSSLDLVVSVFEQVLDRSR